MNKLEKLRAELAELKADGLAIINTADQAGREMTEAENSQYEVIAANITEKQAAIVAQETLEARRRDMQPIGEPHGRNAVHDLSPETTHGFKSIGEFASAVRGAINAAQVGGSIDARLLAATPSGTHRGGGTAGEGYSLPPQYRDEVAELVTDFDEFGGVIDEEPTERREVKLAADETTPWGAAGVKAYWKSEGSQMTATQLADEGRTVPLHELYALTLATEELLEDSPRLQSRLTKKAAQAIAWKKNLAIVEGTGAGQPLGWMKSAALVTVAKEAAQAADTIVSANVVNMYSRLQSVPGDNPFWLVGKSALPQLMTMTIGDKPIWIPPTGLAEAPGGFLLGRPVRFSEFASEVGDKGDIQLISPKGYYGVRRTAGVDFASSMHLYFDYAVGAFRWMFRFGGQPHLEKAISPAKGSITRSHFVTLAARA